MNGTVANANLVYGSNEFTGLGTEAVTLTDTSLGDVADLNTLNGYTTGNVDASTINTLTGTISALNIAYAASSALGNGISGLGNEAVVVSDTGTITDVAALTTLNGNTTGAVNADSVAGFEASISDLNTMYAGAVSSGNGITNIGDKNVSITDTSVSDASTLNTLNGYTSGTITADSVTALTGTASVLNTLLTAGNNASVANQFSANSFASLATATVSDSTMSIADLNGAITQANTATGKSTLAAGATVFSVSSGATINTGAEAAFSTLLDNQTNGLITLTDQNLTVDSGSISVANAILLAAATTGTITATIATTESVDSLKTLYDRIQCN